MRPLDEKRSGKPERMMKHAPECPMPEVPPEDLEPLGVAIARAPRVLPDQSSPTMPTPDTACDGRLRDEAEPQPIRIFDRADVLRRLREIHGHADGLYDDPGTTASGNLSAEELLLSRRLCQLAQDPCGGCRSPLIATSSMITAINSLRIIAPKFESVIGIAANAAAMSHITGCPMQVPPLLLLGPPGIGKTFFAKRLAAAIGSAFLPLAMNLTPAFGLLAGLAPAWKGAAAGKVATTLIASTNAAPVILFDEIEKVVVANAHDRPLDVLHSLWEPENAEAFRDEYYDIPFDASHIISIATANSTVGISPSLLDRLLVLDIKPPTREQRRAIAGQAYAAAITKAGGKVAEGIMDTVLPADILDQLAASTPRRITRLIGLALPMAVAAGRSSITSAEIIAAAALLDSAKVKDSPGIGFIRRES